MPAVLPDRRLLLGAAVTAFVTVFSALLVFERPELGIGRFFYVAVVLLALASGPHVGAAGGLVATGLYVLAVLASPRLPDDVLTTLSMAIRAVTYVGVGYLIGFFAAQHRTLVEYFRLLANRDRLTGLPTSRPFEAELTERLEKGASFALLLGDVDGLGERAQSDEKLRRLPALLARFLHPSDAIARVGPDEFAILASCRSTDEAGALATAVEAAFTAEGLAVTFGWTVSPQEGRNGLALYRAASERLYARKLIRRGTEPSRPALVG
jgi:GGDEF domain-containing protein